jgi:hypothetical protein
MKYMRESQKTSDKHKEQNNLPLSQIALAVFYRLTPTGNAHVIRGIERKRRLGVFPKQHG